MSLDPRTYKTSSSFPTQSSCWNLNFYPRKITANSLHLAESAIMLKCYNQIFFHFSCHFRVILFLQFLQVSEKVELVINEGPYLMETCKWPLLQWPWFFLAFENSSFLYLHLPSDFNSSVTHVQLTPMQPLTAAVVSSLLRMYGVNWGIPPM